MKELLQEGAPETEISYAVEVVDWVGDWSPLNSWGTFLEADEFATNRKREMKGKLRVVKVTKEVMATYG